MTRDTIMKINPKSVLVISYYARLPGACQAEWIDDKLLSFDKLKLNYYVVSSPSSNLYENADFQIRCASTSWHDFKDEIVRAREQGVNFLPLYCWAPFAFIFGFFIDGMHKLLVKGVGEGRWSWSVSAFFAALFIVFSKGRPDVILTTGGPASAHIAGVLLGRLTNTKIICELQDPLSGEGIGRNKEARGMLFIVEKFISRNASKMVYVTKGAANFARVNVNPISDIVSIYPGAPKLIEVHPVRELSEDKSNFKLIHMGSLYSTRNFDTLISAIEICTLERPEITFEVINLGHVDDKIRSRISKFPYIHIEPLRPRIEALQFAQNCDLLVLIQNQDDRSQVTIPYKTYDYLNLGCNILGLTNSDELDKILTEAGHMSCSVSDVEAIAEDLLKFVDNYLELQKKSFASPFDPERAVLDLIEL